MSSTIALRLGRQHIFGNAFECIERKANILLAEQPIDGNSNTGPRTGLALLLLQILGIGDGQSGPIALSSCTFSILKLLEMLYEMCVYLVNNAPQQ